jgi:hypothetical protein
MIMIKELSTKVSRASTQIMEEELKQRCVSNSVTMVHQRQEFLNFSKGNLPTRFETT